MSIKAMKQAIKALEWANEEINGWRDDAYGHDPVDHPEIMLAVTSLRQAIAEAEKQEPVAWMAGNGFYKVRQTKMDGSFWEDQIPLYTHPQPKVEQKPYGFFQYDMRLDAWVQNRNSDKGVAFYTHPQPKAEKQCQYPNCDYPCMDLPDCQEQEPVGWLDGNDRLAEFMHKDLKAEHDKRGSSTPKMFPIPVYTHPQPKREPLTDEYLEELMMNYGYDADDEGMKEMLRDIEAKLKEKNHD